MIHIYRSNYDCPLNLFHGREWVRRDEVVIKTNQMFGVSYTYAEPAIPGNYAFGGTLLYTDNRVFPDFTTPVKLHDRQMDKEG